MLIFQLLREKKIRLEKIICLTKKCIYFLTYRNEHPVVIPELIEWQRNFLCRLRFDLTENALPQISQEYS